MEQQEQSRWRPTRSRVVWTAGVVVALVVVMILFGGYYYGWKWTGLVKDPNFPMRTLWDWLKLLIIPAVLAGGGVWFNRQQREQELRMVAQQRERDKELEKARAQDEALRAYLDQMSHLLLNEDLRNSSEEVSEVRTLARARTLTLLSGLDGFRKALVAQFLYEAMLISKERPVVSLKEADLEGAWLSLDVLRDAALARVNLARANLFRANLTGADLSGAALVEANLAMCQMVGAKLTGAYLWGARLRLADLSEADLSDATLSVSQFEDDPPADLQHANLSGATLVKAKMYEVDLRHAHLRSANLQGADLEGADLRGADLREADLSGADLSGADLSGAVGWIEEQLLEAYALEGATMPNGQKYEDWLEDKKGRGEDGENSSPS